MSSPRQSSQALVADTVRSHRWGIVAWAVGGSVAMLAIGLGYASEVARYPGGAPEMGASMQAAAEAMRLLRWPAERLDTLGGYLTYHNLTLYTLALSVYATVQGAHALRGERADGTMEVLLATGRSRGRILADRAVGFTLALTMISATVGIGLAATMTAGGQADTTGAIVASFMAGLAALVAFGLGTVVVQLLPTARTGTTTAAFAVTVLYVATNVWDQIGPLGVVRYVSPFHWANASRVLVADHALDPAATLILVVAGVMLLAVAAVLFEHRDVTAGLWQPAPLSPRPVDHVLRPTLRTWWRANLRQHRLGLAGWSLTAAGLLGLMAWLAPTVIDMWDDFGFTRILETSTPELSVADQYLAFSAQLVVPILAAYVITQAAGWVSDLEEGRVELVLAAPLNWPRLVLERVTATLAGSALITIGAVAGLSIGSLAVALGVSPAGIVRLIVDALLLATALTALAALIVVWLRRAVAVTVLALAFTASYLLVYLVPLFDWPAWLINVSPFGAFGNPYLELPSAGGFVALVATALAGTALAAAAAGRTPKVA